MTADFFALRPEGPFYGVFALGALAGVPSTLVAPLAGWLIAAAAALLAILIGLGSPGLDSAGAPAELSRIPHAVRRQRSAGGRAELAPRVPRAEHHQLGAGRSDPADRRAGGGTQVVELRGRPSGHLRHQHRRVGAERGTRDHQARLASVPPSARSCLMLSYGV